MRNKRWHIRRALVADLRTDPMIANSRGRTVGRRALSRRVSKHQIRTPQVSRLAPHPTHSLRRVLRRNSRPACS